MTAETPILLISENQPIFTMKSVQH